MAIVKNWIWMPHPAHFICARDCKFFLATCVGQYIVSTVGEMLPSEGAREIYAKSAGVVLEGRGDAREGRIKIPRRSFASDETHQPAKLKNYQVMEIRESIESRSVLAAKFGVTPRAIWAARTRRTFRDVL